MWIWLRAVVVAEFRGDVDACQQDGLSRGGLRQAIDADARVHCEQGCAVTFKWRGVTRERFSADELIQGGGLCACEGVYFGVVFAESDAIEEEEEEIHEYQ